MPKRAKTLSAAEVKKLSLPGRHAVGGVEGLSLNITKTGAKSWILRAVVRNKRRHIGLGPYPEVTLANARILAQENRSEIRSGIDPVKERALQREKAAQEEKLGYLFKDAFNDFFTERVSLENRNCKHKKQWRSTIETYAFPVLGQKPVSDISVEDLLSVLKPIWTEKTETASRVRQRIEAVLDWATVKGYRKGTNPAVWKGNLQQLLPTPSSLKKTKGHPAIKLAELPLWFKKLQSRKGIAPNALMFLTLTAARSGEVRGATWDEIDLSKKVWTIPAERMKAKKEHRVPLSSFAMQALDAAPRFPDCSFIFPSAKGGQLSDMTLAAVMRRIHSSELEAGRSGFLDPRSNRPAVPHGLRSSFRDWAAEQTNYPRELAEMSLAHNVGNVVERAYQRSDLLEKRRALMEDWASFAFGK